MFVFADRAIDLGIYCRYCILSGGRITVPLERMAILEPRAARGWSLKQTADTFLVTPATIASWVKRIEDQDANALLQLREPVN